MILYDFATSPFSRRVRMTLALKGLTAQLRDARADPGHRAEVNRLNPLHTVPVLVDGPRVICDSTPICHYLDRKAPLPPLWPAGLEGVAAFELWTLTESAIDILVDLGMRYSPLHGAPEFPEVRELLVGRAQRAMAEVARRVEGRAPGEPLCGSTWGAADIAVYTTVAWLEGLPARAATFAPAKAIVDLGWSLPASLVTWASAHRDRADVRALDAR